MQIVTTALHRHTWCANQDCVGFDCWEENVARGTCTGAFSALTGRRMLAEAMADGRCPECLTKLDLIDRAREVF
jgi:hypothetical protein